MAQVVSKRSASQGGRRIASSLWLHILVAVPGIFAQGQQDPLTMNGGSVLAMAGENCVAVAVDKRFGSGSSLVHICHRPVLHLPDSTMVAFTGLEGDVQSLRVELAAQVARKYSRGLGFSGGGTGSATRSISATAVASLTSHVLYRRKRSPYYVEPLVVGLEPDGWFDDDDNSSITSGELPGKEADSAFTKVLRSTKKQRYRPYLCCMDMIGAKSESQAFVCAGTASQSLYGTAEALWKPDLTADELVAVCGKAFLSALERDCLSGYGAMIYLLTPDGIVEYDLAGRSD
jgi:20S proteasome subunit beta 3